MICAKCVVYLLINKYVLSLRGTRRWAWRGEYRDERNPGSPVNIGLVGRTGWLTYQGHHRRKKLRGLMVAHAGINPPCGFAYLIPTKFDEVGTAPAPISCVRELRPSKGL